MSEMLLLGRGGQGESRDVYLQCFIEKSRGLKYCGIVKFRGPPKLWKLMKRIKIKNPQQTNAVVMSFASEFISTGASVVFQIPEKQTQEVGVASVIAEGLSGFFFFLLSCSPWRLPAKPIVKCSMSTKHKAAPTQLSTALLKNQGSLCADIREMSFFFFNGV